MTKKIYIGGDHSSPEYKQEIINYLTNKGYQMINLGTNTFDSVDYPDYGIKVAERVANDENSLGIIICGTGIGISIAANKVHGIRAALLYNNKTAKLAKEHNNANVIAFGARMFDIEEIIEMIDNFLSSKFLGERHSMRVNKITTYENTHIISSIERTVSLEPFEGNVIRKEVTSDGTFINDLNDDDDKIGSSKIKSLNDDAIKSLTNRSSKPIKYSKKDIKRINESNHAINDLELHYARGHDWTLTQQQIIDLEHEALLNEKHSSIIIKSPIEKNVDEEMAEIMEGIDESIFDDD